MNVETGNEGDRVGVFGQLPDQYLGQAHLISSQQAVAPIEHVVPEDDDRHDETVVPNIVHQVLIARSG